MEPVHLRYGERGVMLVMNGEVTRRAAKDEPVCTGDAIVHVHVLVWEAC
jgi:hypothetical protein